MLSRYLKTANTGPAWQQGSTCKIKRIYVYLLIILILILTLYVSDIYILTVHEDQPPNNYNVMILHEIEYDSYDVTEPDDDNDPCHFNQGINNKMYIYDIPYYYREQPRKHWYKWIHGKEQPYDDPKGLNFAFWKVMNLSNSNNDYYHTHMHSLEILFNERFKSIASSKYFTKDPSKASLFHIPFPFAMHFRFYNVRDWNELIAHHHFVMNYLSDNLDKTNMTLIEDAGHHFDPEIQKRESAIFKKYFLSENLKPHWLSYTRIAHETSRLTRKESPFWLNENIVSSDINNLHSMISPFWHVSIDRNCGDPRHCIKRISVPHPSVYHPKDKESLKLHIDKLKKLNNGNKRNILVSFCGAVRTETRKEAQKQCNKEKRDKWGIWFKEYSQKHPQHKNDINICHFEDSLEYEQILKEKYNINNAAGRKIKTEIDFSKKCMELYERSIFCIQEGADSTTRKGLWDGIIAGCIPIFLNGVMDGGEFDCYKFGDNYPWYLVLRKERYIEELVSMPQIFIKKLQNNIMRMIPKIIYTSGNAGFNDAFDILIHCLIRKTSYENKLDNPKCTMEHIIQSDRKYDLDIVLGYDKLYKYLEI